MTPTTNIDKKNTHASNDFAVSHSPSPVETAPLDAADIIANMKRAEKSRTTHVGRLTKYNTQIHVPLILLTARIAVEIAIIMKTAIHSVWPLWDRERPLSWRDTIRRRLRSRCRLQRKALLNTSGYRPANGL